MTQENFLEQQPQSYLGSDSEPKGIRVKVMKLVDRISRWPARQLSRTRTTCPRRRFSSRQRRTPDELLIGRRLTEAWVRWRIFARLAMKKKAI